MVIQQTSRAGDARESFMKEALHDWYSGLTVGMYHSCWYAKDLFIAAVVRPVQRVLGVYNPRKETRVLQRLAKLKEGEKPTLKVVGIGYGRTGTYSLTLALEELGFPTLHTQHMYETQEILDMWTHKVFLPSINDGVVTKGSPDFDLIAQYGFQATTDLPAALYYEEIAKVYPDCKFVLTTRKNSEVWYRSWEIMTHSISQPARVGTFFNLSHVRKIGYYLRWLFSFVNKDTKYLSEPFPLSRQIKKKAIESYEEHNRRAREVIPSDKLLEYDVTQGYGPLCQFLNIAEASCPTKPLPQTNSARSVNIQAVASIIFPVIVLCLVLFSLFASVFYWLTGGEKVIPWLKNKKHRVLYHLLTKVEKKTS